MHCTKWAAALIGLLVGTAMVQSQTADVAMSRPATHPTTDRAPATSTTQAAIEAVASKYAEKFTALVPTGWSVKAKGDVVLVTRKEPIEWYNPISLPPHRDVAELKEMGIILKSPYSIRFQVTLPPMPHDIQNMRTENEKTTERMTELMTGIRTGKLGYAPQTQEEQNRYEQYKKLQSRLHRIPDVVTSDAAFIIDPTILSTPDGIVEDCPMGPILMFYSQDVNKECKGVLQSLICALSPTTTKPSDASESKD